ncbi:alpha/beta fold hydrolase [Paraflavitalea sp. CAU 1676]|uniref:RBBP9/YdeN family alpha/beta hydrolase n=1 Tax=Paraflavitalea sp. CAU 1676 TaxID=3032598 RepID=UPI0023DACC95|nr:alpha/beta fold hydrolase [Paraflavitalea sp. CAU 1676]MDF2190236.1 alpha/beta fold hydrolase [Paraflavitalea sp. CAU 1676]
MNPIVFILPGLYDSGPQHWQTHWEQTYGFTRIRQRDWDTPVCADWLQTIDGIVSQQPLDQVILVGHSLACSTIVRWATAYDRTIKGALLVGPSDVEAPSYPPGTTGFMPMPLHKLPFPSITVASTNDEYVSIERAQQFADAWGSRLVNVGDYGHINSTSNLGLWPEGMALLKQLY